jgi:hypothetical protein
MSLMNRYADPPPRKAHTVPTDPEVREDLYDGDGEVVYPGRRGLVRYRFLEGDELGEGDPPALFAFSRDLDADRVADLLEGMALEWRVAVTYAKPVGFAYEGDLG